MNKITEKRLKNKFNKIRSIFYKQKIKSKQRGHVPPTYTVEELSKFMYDNNYIQLHKEWADSNYDTKLAPSIDRLENDKGYSLDNIQLVTWEENYRLSHVASSKPVLQYTTNGVFIKEFNNSRLAEIKTNIPRTAISHSAACSSVALLGGGYIWIYKEDFTEDLLNKKIKRYGQDPSKYGKIRDVREILCFNIYGDLIKEYSSINSVNLDNFSPQHVRSVLFNRLKTHKKRLWFFKDTFNKDKLNKILDILENRVIIRYNIKTKEIQIYSNLTALTIKLKHILSSTTISRCLRYNREDLQGYKYMRKLDFDKIKKDIMK